jgi:hypothetical protein
MPTHLSHDETVAKMGHPAVGVLAAANTGVSPLRPAASGRDDECVRGERRAFVMGIRIWLLLQ